MVPHSSCTFGSLEAGEKGMDKTVDGGMEETKQAVAPLKGRADLLC